MPNLTKVILKMPIHVKAAVYRKGLKCFYAVPSTVKLCAL